MNSNTFSQQESIQNSGNNADITADDVKRFMNQKLINVKQKQTQKQNFTYQCLVKFMNQIAEKFDFEAPDKLDVLDLFRQLDTNGNGKLSEGEIKVFTKKLNITIMQIIKDPSRNREGND